jgi:hypothetical protein
LPARVAADWRLYETSFMNAQTDTPANRAGPTSGTAPRFDRKFIEAHQLVERYLQNKLPPKGARELENWCRSNPEYLEELGLPERTLASLKLLENSGRPQDLQEPKLPWWRTPYLSFGLGAVALLSVAAAIALFSETILLNGKLNAARALATHGSLTAPTVHSSLKITPDHAPGIDSARFRVAHGAANLVEVHIDMSYAAENMFRVFVDKQDQGRALVLENLFKDSNGELKVAFNSSGLAVGRYDVRIEGVPARGGPIAEGWLYFDVN